jgi:hypothetical protein
MGQRLLHWIEKQATEGEMLICDLYLKKGAEYEIRGRVSKDAGEMQLSIRSTVNAPIRTFAYKRGFGFIAPEEGMYQVWAGIRPIQGKELAGRAVVTVNQTCPIRSMLDGIPFVSYAEQPLGRSSEVRTAVEKRTDRHPEQYDQRRAG